MIKHITNKKIIESFISDCMFKNIEFTIDDVVEKTRTFCELHNIEFDEGLIRSHIKTTIAVLKNKNMIECFNGTYVVMYESFDEKTPSESASNHSYTMNDHYHY